MTASLLWILVPLAPLLMSLAVLLWRDRAIPLCGLGALPALLASLLTPEPLLAGNLWPGAQLGGAGLMLRSLLAFTALLWMLAGQFAVHSLATDDKRRRFWLFWLLSFSGNLLLIIAGDALGFYLGFSVMSLAAYGLIIHKPGPRARRAGRLYLQLAIGGELLLLTGLSMAAHTAGGSMNLADWQQADMSPLTLILLFTALGLKAGFWPLHVWLPRAHPVAPAPASAVLSGVMIKAGIIGYWQLMPAASPVLQQWALPLMGLALFSSFYGVVLGMGRDQPKEVLAWSSVSQMGYLLLITALLWYHPEAVDGLTVLLCLYIVHHGTCKAALFLSAELLEKGRPASRRRRLALAAAITLPALALAGLPLTSGAVVKTLLKEELEAASLEPIGMALQLGAMATTLLLLRVLFLLRPLGRGKQDRSLSPPLLRSWLPLALLPLALPWLWPGTREITIGTLTLYKLSELLWPLTLALLAALTALSLRWQLPRTGGAYRLQRGSLALKKLLQPGPAKPSPERSAHDGRWRRLERHWNRMWGDAATRQTAWLLLAVLLAIGLAVALI